MIRQRRIQHLGRHIRGLVLGSQISAALRIDNEIHNRLIEAGFDEPFEPGQSILPSSHLGNAARFNAEGREDIHRDQPKETVYRPVEWTHEQWNGPYTETVTEVVERRYERYPRTFIAPPSVELTIRQSPSGVLYVCGPERTLGQDNDLLLHDINLILDISHQCELLPTDFTPQIEGDIRKLNWSVLPRGHYPWDRLKTLVRPSINRLPAPARPVIEHRLEIVSRYPHDFVAIGRAGFNGYVIFAFPAHGIYVLECTHEGNATYIFGHDWEQLSQMTKAEILRDDAHVDRLVHTRRWKYALAELMRQHGYVL